MNIRYIFEFMRKELEVVFYTLAKTPIISTRSKFTRPDSSFVHFPGRRLFSNEP
jgi:hypothetical protein